MTWRKIKLEEVLYHRKQFITIEDFTDYKRCRVQVNRKGVVLRDIVKGLAINTKKQQVCRSGDFLVAEIDAKVGGYGFIGDDLDGAIVSSHYFLFEIQEDKMMPAYFAELIKTDIIQNQINSRGSTNYAAIRPMQFLSLEIMLPTLEKQLEIVNKISAFEKVYIPIKEEICLQITALEYLRKSILQDAIQGKLVPHNPTDEPASVLLERVKEEKQRSIGVEKLRKEKPIPQIKETELPFNIPTGWSCCRMQQIAYVGNGSTPSKSEFTTNRDDIPYLKVYNIVDQKVSFDYKPQYIKSDCHYGQLKRSICYSGDVIMNIVGPPLGKIAIIPEEIKECNINQAIVVIRPYLNSLNQWIYIYLCEKSAVNAIVTKGMAGQDNISVTQSRNLVIPIPPLKEQHRIVSKVNQLMRLCDDLDQQIFQSKVELEHLLKAVLQEAFEDINAIRKQVTKQDEVFWQKQLLASYINMLMAKYQEQGEMAIAKYAYLNDKLYNAGSGFRYVQHNFGPYSQEIKDYLAAPSKLFYKKPVGKNGYEVYYVSKELGADLIDLGNSKLQEALKGFSQLMQVFSAFPMRERARHLELVASLCWLIEQLQSTNIHTLYEGLESWLTPKRQVQHKGQLFSKEVTEAGLQLIMQQGWHLKLLSGR